MGKACNYLFRTYLWIFYETINIQYVCTLLILQNTHRFLRVIPDAVVFVCCRFFHKDIRNQSPLFLFCWSTNHQRLQQWSAKGRKNKPFTLGYLSEKINSIYISTTVRSFIRNQDSGMWFQMFSWMTENERYRVIAT